MASKKSQVRITGRRRNGGNVARRTANPSNAEEAKAACLAEARNVILSYVQNDLFIQMGLDRENTRLAFGFSGHDTLKEFFKSQSKNYENRTPQSEIETEFDTNEFMKPQGKQKTPLQEYPKESVKDVIQDK